MNQKKLLLILLLGISVFARDKVHEDKGRGNFGIPFSFVMGNYQDLMAAKMRYRGAGLNLGFEYTHYLPKQNEVGASLNLEVFLYSGTTNDTSSFSLVGGGFDLFYNHLFPLSNNFSLVLGTEIQWYGNILNNSNLQNNASSSMFLNPFFLTIGGENRFKNDKPLRYTLGVALIGFVNRHDGFAFNTDQSSLEDGTFLYSEDPHLGYDGARFYFISKNHVQLNFNVAYQFHRRWEVSYEWNLLHSSYEGLEDYDLNVGTHDMRVTFLF